MGSNKETRVLNPFPGLRPFAPEESELFFGREKESEEVLKKLLKNRFVTVIGASGSGKSSLIYCGVLPKVRNLEKEGSSAWKIIMFRPGNDPLGNLSNSVRENITTIERENISPENILLDMHLNPDGITSALNKYLIKDDNKILLVVDQFEELFRYSKLGSAESKGVHTAEFVGKLVSAIEKPEGRIFTIVTMRSDFIGEC